MLMRCGKSATTKDLITGSKPTKHGARLLCLAHLKGSATMKSDLSLWMQTANGRKFYLLNPTAEQVFADDIFAALPLIPCFNGAQENGKHEYPYSVAQHCLLVSRLVAPELALDALLHDAWKIYVGDLTRPLNQLLNQISNGHWNIVRGGIQNAVAQKFNLTFPLPDAVEDGDRQARANELRDVMADVPELWSLKLPEPTSEIITPLHPSIVRAQYVERFADLMLARAQQSQG
jgi:uncharacterized protein